LPEQKSTLIVPGDPFHSEHRLRIGYGGDPGILKKGLASFSELVEELLARA
jgi:hypothetical protein